MKNLTFGFSIFGFLIVVLQLLPNIFWALFPPAVNSLEGNASSMLFIEYGEHILGVSIVILLSFLINKTQTKKIPNGKLTIISFAAIALYWICWLLYFCKIQPLFIIYSMVILPPFAFFCAGIAEKVYLISVLSVVFLMFHLYVAIENFPIF